MPTFARVRWDPTYWKTVGFFFPCRKPSLPPYGSHPLSWKHFHFLSTLGFVCFVFAFVLLCFGGGKSRLTEGIILIYHWSILDSCANFYIPATSKKFARCSPYVCIWYFLYRQARFPLLLEGLFTSRFHTSLLPGSYWHVTRESITSQTGACNRKGLLITNPWQQIPGFQCT